MDKNENIHDIRKNSIKRKEDIDDLKNFIKKNKIQNKALKKILKKMNRFRENDETV